MQSKLKKLVVFTIAFCMLGTQFVLAASYPKAYSVPKPTSNKASSIATCAESQRGYTEKDGTAYGQWYTDYVRNGKDYTKKWWGTIFLNWCAVKSGISSEIIPTQSCCSDGIKRFKNLGVYYSPSKITAKRGDIIYFKYGQVGIVTACDGTYVRFVEGDSTSNGAVSSRSVKVSDSTIHGYARPNYNKVITHAKPTKSIGRTSKNVSVDNIKWIQQALFKIGYEINIDGVYGLNVENAVKKVQKKYNLTVNGIVDTATRNKLANLIGDNSKELVEVVDSNKKYNSASTSSTSTSKTSNNKTSTSKTSTSKTNTSKTTTSKTTTSKTTTSNTVVPKNLKAVCIASGKLRISWTASSAVTGYQIYRATSLNGKYSQIRFISNNKTSFFDNVGLSKNKTYYYIIRSYKDVKGKWYFSSWSKAVKGIVK